MTDTQTKHTPSESVTAEMMAEHHATLAFQANCVRAIETAAARLGIDPAVAAERWANGEIATLAEAVNTLDSSAACAIDDPDSAEWSGVRNALKPFAKEG